jgi:acetoin utilization deacetylase AcuC-like enzyme
MFRVGWLYDPLFCVHETGPSHVETSQRLTVILDELRRRNLLPALELVAFQRATPDEIAIVHDPVYITLVQMMCDEGFSFVGTSETRICGRSFDAAAQAVGCVLGACNALMEGRVQRAFCAVRPPGHHAEIDRAMGFCLFNNLAVGAEFLVRRWGVSRLAIVDIDAHHGNGTQHFFEDRSDVLYISLHERPGSLPFPGSGHANERGSGPGTGYTLNVPLDRGTRETEYLRALTNLVIPALISFRPEVLMMSAGFDALAGDPLCHLALKPESYRLITEKLSDVAVQFAEGRMISVLEGGYDLDQLGPAVAYHILGLLEPDPPQALRR